MKASDPSAETWELDKLLTYTEDKPVEFEKYFPKLGPVETMKKVEKLKPSSDPLLNFIIRLLRQIAPIPIITKTLRELSDGDLLDRARKYSYRYDISINRWELLLRSSLFQEASLGKSLPIQGKGKIFEPNVSKLTLVQVEQLANFNLPEISETERLLNEARFTLPSIGVPLDPTSATLFVEVALLLLSAYFWIWYREARVSPNFPASGTLFGALARSASSRVMFSLLIALPPIAAALVAVRTARLNPWNVVFAILVTFVAFLVRHQGKL